MKEPIFNTNLPKEEWSNHMGYLLRWYNTNEKLSHKISIDYLLDWVKTHRPDDLVALQQVNQKLFLKTWGWVARIVTLCSEAPNCTQFLNKAIDNLLVVERGKRKEQQKKIDISNNSKLVGLTTIINSELATIKQKLLESKKDVVSNLDLYEILVESKIDPLEAKELFMILEKDQLTISNLKNNYNEEEAKKLGFTSKARLAVYSAILYKLTQQARKYYNEVKKLVMEK